MKQVKCECCGRVREDGKVMFCIGASKVADWVMNVGTGNMNCPDCHKRGLEDGRRAIDEATRPFVPKLVESVQSGTKFWPNRGGGR